MADPNGEVIRERRPMSEGELKGILNAKVTNSLGYYGGKLSRARVQALQYYNGEPFGNEKPGRSSVISRDVAEAIDGMMPSLLRIFAAGDEIVRFEPTRPETLQQARQATDYCNWIFMQQNKGFQNLYTLFKDSLLNRTAALKIWWDTELETNKEEYRGLTERAFELLMEDAEDDELEILEHDTYPDPLAAATASLAAPAGAGGAIVPGASPPPQMPGQEAEPQLPMLHDVVLRRTNKTGRVHILPIPGEEFLMDRRAVSLEETPFVAHRCKKTISDLLEMGYPYDLVKNLGEGDSSDFNLERLERFRQEDELPYRTGNNYDPSMREVWINECYIKVDFDGDGIAELRKVTFAGESGNFAPGATVILSNEEVGDHPFVAACPIPMPHKFYGMSVADQTMDIQLIKSTVLRTTLDHSYNAIMPQVLVDETRVNLDDLLTRRPGGAIRTKGNPNEVAAPLVNGQLGVDPYQLISYLDQVRETRTGVRRFTAGPGADALDNAFTNTATGANLVENSSQERIELIARCYAEICLKPAFRKILKLVTQNQTEAKIIRLRGQFVTMDPREWADDFDMTVTVGLGTGSRQQQVQGLAMLLGLDNQIIQFQRGLNGPLLTAENLYNKLDKACAFLGFRGAESYYTDPKTMPQQPQQPQQDPRLMEAQIAGRIELQKAQINAAATERKTQLELAADNAKATSRLEADVKIAAIKVAAEREIEYAKLAANREEFNAQAMLDVTRDAANRALGTGAKGHIASSPAKTQPNAKPKRSKKRITVRRDPASGSIVGADVDEMQDDGMTPKPSKHITVTNDPTSGAILGADVEGVPETPAPQPTMAGSPA